jgi:hypothetical protein
MIKDGKIVAHRSDYFIAYCQARAIRDAVVFLLDRQLPLGTEVRQTFRSTREWFFEHATNVWWPTSPRSEMNDAVPDALVLSEAMLLEATMAAFLDEDSFEAVNKHQPSFGFRPSHQESRDRAPAVAGANT